MKPVALYDYHFLFKMIVIGDSGVGKSALLKKMTKGEYSETNESTIGVDFFSHYSELENEKVVKTQIWDTAGQEIFRSIVSNYYRNSSGIVLMCDVTNEESFNNLEKWINDVKEYSNHDKDYICLLANKIDLVDKRTVTTEMLKSFADKHDMPFFELSVKENHNLESIFQKYVEYLYDKHDLSSLDTDNIYDLNFQNKIKEINKYGITCRKNVKKRKIKNSSCYTARDIGNCCVIS